MSTSSSDSVDSRFWWWAGAVVLLALVLVLVLLDMVPRVVLIRTFVLGLGASLVAIPMGGAAAWVCLSRGWVARCLLLAIAALLLLPIIVQVSAWDAAFGKLGWLTSAQGVVLMPLVSGWAAGIWIHGVAATPQVALILMIFAWNDRSDYEEQASLDATPLQVFRAITLPRYLPVIFVSILWVMVTCAREIAVTDLYQIGTLAEQVYLGYSISSNSLLGVWSVDQLSNATNLDHRLTWITIGLLAMIGSLMFLYLTAMSQRSDADRFYRQSDSNGWQTVVGIILLFVLTAVPIGNTLARASFHIVSNDGVAEQRYEVARIPTAVSKSVKDYSDEMIWSGLIAVCASTSIMLTVMLVTAWGQCSVRGRIGFSLALAFGFAVPGPVLGNGLNALFQLPRGEFFYWLTDYTIFPPVVASALFCWPICGLMVWFLFGRISDQVLESARLEGVGFWRRLWFFQIRANRWALLGCWLLGLALCFGELSASQMVRPPGMDTVPRKMLGDLHAGVNELTAGITIVIAILVVAISLLGWSLIWLNIDRDGRK